MNSVVHCECKHYRYRNHTAKRVDYESTRDYFRKHDMFLSGTTCVDCPEFRHKAYHEPAPDPAEQ